MRHALAILLVLLLTPATSLAQTTQSLANTTIDGYRGIWFTLGQKTQYGDKYSGGLGTYTANHIPIAVYSPEADKTFFVYGGTVKGQRHLLIMASFYDHKTGRVPRPVVVHDKEKVNDPHDNASMTIDSAGHLWVFVSGRARNRPGFIYRSSKPYDVSHFERLAEREMTYPQIHHSPDNGFFYLFTKYTRGRELYWQTSPDGRSWSPEQKLAGFGGHYQVSNLRRPDNLVASTFMWHPGGNVDKRTNLYYAQSPDFGQTWQTIDGKPLTTPLDSERNPALLVDYQSQGLNVYIHDLNFDRDGRPVILYLTGKGHAPGPDNGRRTWRITRWDGSSWQTHTVTTSDHNYDTGCLHIAGDTWTVLGPTDDGPQPWSTGGEIALWQSTDSGATWRNLRAVTCNSTYNHSYARRPLHARDPFFSLWADGDPTKLSESRLFFCDSTGEKVYQLPYDMPAASAEPTPLSP